MLKQLYRQTNLNSLKEVALVLGLYETTTVNWLKKGLENVLLQGEFPVAIPVNLSIVPTRPVVWPTDVPFVKFEPYCNYNDYKGESLTKAK